MKGNIRELYSTMLRTRVGMVSISKMYLRKALLIAIRYSIVRRQFKNISGKKEET